MFDFSISSQVRRGGFSIAGGRPSRLNGSVKGVRIKNIPPLSHFKPKITLMAALARSWAAGSKKKGICKSRCLSFWQGTRIQNPWAVYSLPDQFPTGYLAGGACAVNPELRQRRRMRRDGFATLTHQKYRRRARSTEANPKTKCDLLKQVAFCFGSGRRIRIRNQLFL